MLDRRLLRTLALVALLALALIGGALVSQAQDDDDSGEVGQPLLASAAAECDNGNAAVKVWIRDRFEPYTVTLTGSGGVFGEPRQTTFDEDKRVQFARFDAVPAGEYEVSIDGADLASDGLHVVVDCGTDPGPVDGPLDVQVECRGGWGIAHFQVTNPATGELSDYSVVVNGITEFEVTVGPDVFVRIAQNLYDDNIDEDDMHVVELKQGRQVIARKEFRVACGEGNAPTLDVKTTCADLDGASSGTVAVGVFNPNRGSVTYTVVVEGESRTIRLGGSQRGTVTFTGVSDGTHPVTVIGDDETGADISTTVDCAEAPPTTTTSPTQPTEPTQPTQPTSEPGSSPPPATTTTPAPQARADDDLAGTGAAVGGLVVLAAIGLTLGGALLWTGRRRRAHQD